MKEKVEPQINLQWKKKLIDQFNSDYFLNLKKFLQQEKKKYTIYPPGNKIFEAFNKTPFENVKVVIIGQDPYHGPGQANGLCFSVSEGISQPPSLKNIFKELHNDLSIPVPRSGDLEKWAEQGVLLLNATLTVRKKQPASHKEKGWEKFTNAVIEKLSEDRSGLIFLLWGGFAKKKEYLIDNSKHYVLKAAHPSPFSANNGFFGCKHFSTVNKILKDQGKKEIDWRIE